jgi:hypothetical protein
LSRLWAIGASNGTSTSEGHRRCLLDTCDIDEILFRPQSRNCNARPHTIGGCDPSMAALGFAAPKSASPLPASSRRPTELKGLACKSDLEAKDDFRVPAHAPLSHCEAKVAGPQSARLLRSEMRLTRSSNNRNSPTRLTFTAVLSELRTPKQVIERGIPLTNLIWKIRRDRKYLKCGSLFRSLSASSNWHDRCAL